MPTQLSQVEDMPSVQQHVQIHHTGAEITDMASMNGEM
jgi:hypothetical protein